MIVVATGAEIESLVDLYRCKLANTGPGDDVRQLSQRLAYWLEQKAKICGTGPTDEPTTSQG